MSLPSGYRKLEYIQSSGTQYIDTGFKPKQSTRVVMDLQLLSTSGVPYVFGTWAGGMNNCFSVYWWTDVHNSWGVDYGTQRSAIPQTNSNKRLIVDLNQNVVTVDSVSYTLTVTTFTATNNLFLLALNNGNNALDYTVAKVYGCKIYDNGMLVRDFIPCKNASGAVGMLDDVNNTFYSNAGSGTFTAGPEAKGTNKTLIGGTEYDVNAGKCLVGGTAYAIKKGRTLIGGTGYDISLAGYDPVFSNNEWSAIIDACKSGNVPETWVVGDHKNMTINGTSYQIDIIGKNHDTYTAGGKAPLTFQMHDCYDTLRNMSQDTIKTFLPGIISSMPSEVQSGITQVNKLTYQFQNQVWGSYPTESKLFLLSEVEVFGSTTFSMAGEGTQYAYYQAGNSKVKKHSGSAVFWWERSPYGSTTTIYCCVTSDGGASVSGRGNTYGLSFGFCF